MDIRAIGRAIFLLGKAGGGSTITRQLARNSLNLLNDNRYHRKIKEIVLAELEKMKDVTSLELKEAKTFLEGEFLLEYEENNKMADLLAFWDQMGDVNSAFDYVDKIKKITAKDIKHVIEKHFKHHTMTVISKDTEENQV